ncbi:MAG TPA: glutathione S-transferase family protein [Rhodospirillales bacterium]|jgi:putative glutathione S-transferase|nr:glutathione S-transferase family protein [Rhodospirillales bacterium]HJO68646.1 glutathione S-transferase family protein [Rhodospirillales bacterium]
MGSLIAGAWRNDRVGAAGPMGRFDRQPMTFRRSVTADGSGDGFMAEPGRYHLYVSYACPWAHRTLIVRTLKRLDDVVSVTAVDPLMGEDGWQFSDADGCGPDPVGGFDHLHEVYTKADPRFTGRVTVPVLWDKERATIVNNESADIIRMFNDAFNAFGDAALDLYPKPMRQEIDRVNERVYETVNNGVYKARFAGTREAYEEAFDALFETFEALELSLSRQRYLAGERITEADWRLFTTLVRFDAVYHGHFKCNKRRLIDYANLWAYARELYQVPGVADTVDMDHIKRHYYWSHDSINPTRIVPKGPEIDFTAPHGRDRR